MHFWKNQNLSTLSLQAFLKLWRHTNKNILSWNKEVKQSDSFQLHYITFISTNLEQNNFYSFHINLKWLGYFGEG